MVEVLALYCLMKNLKLISLSAVVFSVVTSAAAQVPSKAPAVSSAAASQPAPVVSELPTQAINTSPPETNSAFTASRQAAVDNLMAKPDIKRWSIAIQRQGYEVSFSAKRAAAPVAASVKPTPICHVIALSASNATDLLKHGVWEVCGDSIKQLEGDGSKADTGFSVAKAVVYGPVHLFFMGAIKGVKALFD